jgi:hypothetical protein
MKRILVTNTTEDPDTAALVEGFDDAVLRGLFAPWSVNARYRWAYKRGFEVGIDTLDMREDF